MYNCPVFKNTRKTNEVFVLSIRATFQEGNSQLKKFSYLLAWDNVFKTASLVLGFKSRSMS